jgi:hypothetical protein
VTLQESLGYVLAARYLNQPIPEEQEEAVLAALPREFRIKGKDGGPCPPCILAKVRNMTTHHQDCYREDRK